MYLEAWTTDTQRLNLKFFVAQIQISIQNKNICELTHSTKMGADSPAKNTPNVLKLLAQNVCASPKSRDFQKITLWVSVVRA